MYHALKQHFLRFMPEIKAHCADVYARVIAVSDAPTNGQTSSFDRPALSATVQILKLNGEPDLSIPEFPSLPVPSSSLGLNAIAEGDLVLVGFAFGSPRHPVIKTIYPNGAMMPNLNSGQQWAGDASNYQTINGKGIFRAALNEIKDTSFLRNIKANLINIEAARETKTVKGLWSSTVGALLFKSYGSLRLISGTVLNISSLGNINFKTKKDLSSVATGNHTMTAKGFYIGTDAVDLIAQVEALAAKVSALDDLVKAHTHGNGNLGTPTAAPIAWVGVKADVDKIKGDIAGLKIAD